MKRVRPSIGVTRILWEPALEELICEKCKAVLFYNFKFERCPYCHRDIAYAEERRAKSAHV